ncbi:MBL fold metallo-hydrolase [Candidatus Solincola tengchongensis]|uniref:MBL fold metallo-hydrolase n=1 Tax=Candidatus Solincola tengchongensis TaxID=2900693 RepID=UPI00257D3DF9
MEIITFTDYSFGSNTYLAVNEEEGKAVLIDAGVSPSQVLKYLEDHGLQLEAVLLTHGHPDHLMGLKEIVDATGAPAYMHPADAEMVKSISPLFLRMLGLDDLELPEEFLPLEDGQELELGGMKFKVLHTPGHSEGSVCFLTDGVLFDGDLVFRGSIGRTDFPGGSMQTLLRSVKEKIFTLPSETRIYPGHLDSTVVGWEKRTNPFLIGI